MHFLIYRQADGKFTFGYGRNVEDLRNMVAPGCQFHFSSMPNNIMRMPTNSAILVRGRPVDVNGNPSEAVLVRGTRVTQPKKRRRRKKKEFDPNSITGLEEELAEIEAIIG